MTETFLTDDLAESLAAAADRIPDARRLAERIRTGARGRAAVRGLAGSARAYLASWLQRETGNAVLYVVSHGDAFEAARDDVEYFRGRGATLAFPEPDTLPYDPASPHPSVTAERLEALSRLAAGDHGVVIATVRGLSQRIPRPARLAKGVLRLRVGNDYDPLVLAERLTLMGYERLPEVEAVGHFARRGGILDIYAVGLADPIRLEFDGDTVASMRRFDAGTQRSLEQLVDAVVLPRFEVVVQREELAAVTERVLRAERRDDVDGRGRVSALFHDGMERFAAHYDPDLGTLLDYLPDDVVVVLDDPGKLRIRAGELQELIERGFAEARAHYPGVSRPDELFHPPSDALDRLEQRPGADWMSAVGSVGDASRYAENLFLECSPAEPMQRSIERLKNHLAELGARRIEAVVLCDNAGQRDRLIEMLGDTGARLGVGLISAGFTLPAGELAILTDHEIFARYHRRRRRRHRTGGLTLAELSALRIGDFVVHEDHGIGTYRGMKRLTLNGQETDCVEIAYAASDRLFVPVQQLGLVSRYSAAEGARPAIHRLGSPAWQKTKAKAKQAIQDMAESLLRAYAARKTLAGHAFAPDSVWQREFEASFPYDETPDQLKAIEEVKKDLESGMPMDRLVCGDVGYGKTEVAIRAAFKCVQEGKQVAILVPTTILAQQHQITFRERYADFPVRVEVLSRFRTPREQKQVLAKLATGEVDVVIGTHRLLSKDVRYKNLGLVVIDEEHRFGVAQKERIRQLTRTVHVLAMTATPIPRTLNLSLAGARDLSVIETPPLDRLPVHTEILEHDDEVIADAVLREVDRGGQVFHVHNRVETIHNVAIRLQRLLPQVRVSVAHGQMPERQLEQVMLDFLDRRSDVLVSTMIIESGLDIPSVNTLIVDRADTLGLAQLYQLRGRVGRSSHRAFAYLLVPSRRVLTEDAEKRLRVIEEFDDLGMGFKVALKDLEIRGAGNLLGPEQSGFIIGLGFDLYVKLLEEAVATLRGEAAEVRPEPRLLTDWSAFLPDDYVPDEHEKLNLYRRLAEVRALAELDDLVVEMLDRFGQLPEPAVALFELRRMRLLGAGANVESLRVFQGVTEMTLRRPMRPDRIQALVRTLSFPLEFISGREFGIRVRGESIALLNRVRQLLETLAALEGSGNE